MRLGDEGSDNFSDRTGQSGGGGFGFGGGGGNMLGCLLPFVLSRFGIVGVVILLLGYCALTSLGGGGGLLGGGGGAPTTTAPSGQSTLSAEDKQILGPVLRSTEDVWGAIFKQAGQTYQPTQMIAYSRAYQSGCGAAQSAMGPFYCPTDKSIYIDPEFFDELTNRFQAAGDFAQAYVIAHEVGHHIQDLEGTLDRGMAMQQQLGETQGNRVQVGIELQADCYAGVWAANAKAPDGTRALDPGDVEEGMRAAEAIGDDTLQRQAQGRVVPESFTHGTSAQRQQALRTGLQSGDPAACAVYAQGGY